MHDFAKSFTGSSFEQSGNSVFYQFGKAEDSVCVCVCVAQSEAMLKEDINRRRCGVEMTLTSSWIIKGAVWRRGGEGGGGGSDEVRASALNLCQEVCVWANELRKEALSQEAWPRERPMVLASPPHTHVTTLHTSALCRSHNTLFPSQHHACERTTCMHAVHAFIAVV